MNEIYIVKISNNQEEDHILFATFNEELAIKHTERVNKFLQKWKLYYKNWYKSINHQSNTYKGGSMWKYYYFRDVDTCYYDTLEIR